MLGEGTGVIHHEGYGYFGDYLLPRLFNAFPNKSRAQDIVSPDQPLPGGFQSSGVNSFRKVDDQLLDVNA